MSNEIDEKQLAERLRSIENKIGFTHIEDARMELDGVIEELDPPKPEPGTVVWWKASKYDRRRYGLVVSHTTGINAVVMDTGGELLFDEIGKQGIDWDVVRIPARDEVVIKIPPAREWPKYAVDLTLYWTPDIIRRGKAPHAYPYPYKTIITRNKAECVEANDE